MNIIRFLQRKTDVTFMYDYKTVAQGLRLMRSHGYTAMPVVSQDGLYLGTVEEGDFLWYILDYGGYDAVKDRTVAEMVKKGKNAALRITATDEEIKNAAEQFPFLVITDDRGAFVGIVTRKAILRYFAEGREKIAAVANA